VKVATVAQMRALDRRAQEEFGIPPEILMENAGDAAYSVIAREFGVQGKRFIVFCGTGNNGGDGFVVARKIHSAGGHVVVFLLGRREGPKGPAKKNFDMLSRTQVEVYSAESPETVQAAIYHSDAVVDAVIGTGLTREVEGTYRDVIRSINDSGKKVFSIDIPSGVNGDSGEVMGAGVRADYTITYGLPKIGNLLYPGNDLCGKLYVSHISFPPSLYNADSIAVEISDLTELPRRGKDTHKGSYGKALFVAGSSKYLGAPYFSALSFLKAGGGLSYLAAPKSITPFLANKGSEVVLIPQQETKSGGIALQNRDELLDFSQNVSMVVIGPGLSLDDETQELVRELAKNTRKPLLIDGDGITAAAADLDAIRRRKAETVLTPHTGEMARIASIEMAEIQSNKIDILRRAAKDLNAAIVLKGAHSLVGYPDGRVSINSSGNPGMATAGSGDVLTGTIAAMHGLGLSLSDAVRTGVFIHGLSGDLAARDRGEDGITAQDILDYLPYALKHYREDFSSISQNLYGSVYVV
jgi:hydroxyethylthiazole kinase-like uncharacterized protein yjeF